MSDNLRIWNAVSKTNPAHTKKVNQRGGFTAIGAQYQILAATEQFGPIGIGWGYTTGAPIITERRPYGTRHVPGRYPWGGYDISHTAIDPDRIVEGAKPVRCTPDFPLEHARAATSPGIGLGD